MRKMLSNWREMRSAKCRPPDNINGHSVPEHIYYILYTFVFQYTNLRHIFVRRHNVNPSFSCSLKRPYILSALITFNECSKFQHSTVAHLSEFSCVTVWPFWHWSDLSMQTFACSITELHSSSAASSLNPFRTMKEDKWLLGLSYIEWWCNALAS